MPMKPELMPLLERFLGDEVIDRQFKCKLLPPEALPERRAALCRADELYCAIDAPLIQHPNPDAVGRATLSKWRRKQPISQALFSRITSLYFNLSTPPSAKLSYTDLCACLLAYDGLDSTVFEYLLEYRMYAVTRHLLKQLGPEQSAKCVPLSSAPKAAVFLALRRREFPDGGAGIEATQAGGRADGWRLLALRSPDARPSMLMPFYTPPTLVQLAVNQLLLHPPAMPPYSPPFGGSPVANSPPPPVSSSFLATAAHSHGAPLSAPIALSSSSCSISSTASGSDSQDRLFGSLSHEAWCAALQPQAPYFCFLRFAPPDVLPRFLALIQSLHDAIPFSDLSAHPSGAPLYATLHYNHNVIQLVMPPDMRSLELYIGGTLVLDTSQANWFTPSPLATLIDGFAALGLVAEDIWPFLIVLLNWISYGASPHEVLFPASLFPPHAPGATLPRAEWWHHMLSVFAPLNFPAAICVERDGRDELGFNEDLEMSYLMDSSGPLEELSVC